MAILSIQITFPFHFSFLFQISMIRDVAKNEKKKKMKNNKTNDDITVEKSMKKGIYST